MGVIFFFDRPISGKLETHGLGGLRRRLWDGVSNAWCREQGISYRASCSTASAAEARVSLVHKQKGIHRAKAAQVPELPGHDVECCAC